jgi:SAM-dependent methyltransferase
MDSRIATDPRAWPAAGDPAGRSGRDRGPVLTGTWGRNLLAEARLCPGDRVLDLSWGTGTVRRGEAVRVQPGRPGAGPGPETSEEARADHPATHWRTGDATSLPFGDASFDVVLCQQGVQLFPDRVRALSEMLRVLAPRGRVAVAVWGPIERNPAFAVLAASLERRAGVRVAAAVHWLFSLPEPGDLRALLAGAGFGGIRVHTTTKVTRFRSVAEFLGRCIPGSPVGPAVTRLCEDDRRGVIADLETALAPWLDTDGLSVPTETNMGLARREAGRVS